MTVLSSESNRLADQTAKILTSSTHSIPERHVNVNNLSPVIITPDQASAPDNLSPPTAPPQVEKTHKQACRTPPASEQPCTLQRRAGTSGATDPGPLETIAIKPTNTTSVDNVPLVALKRGPGHPKLSQENNGQGTRYAFGIMSISAKFLININRHASFLDGVRDALRFTVHANYV